MMPSTLIQTPFDNAENPSLESFMETAKLSGLKLPDMSRLVKEGKPLTQTDFQLVVTATESPKMQEVILRMREEVGKLVVTQSSQMLISPGNVPEVRVPDTIVLPTAERILAHFKNAQYKAIYAEAKQKLEQAVEGGLAQKLFESPSLGCSVYFDEKNGILGQCNENGVCSLNIFAGCRLSNNFSVFEIHGDPVIPLLGADGRLSLISMTSPLPIRSENNFSVSHITADSISKTGQTHAGNDWYLTEEGLFCSNGRWISGFDIEHLEIDGETFFMYRNTSSVSLKAIEFLHIDSSTKISIPLDRIEDVVASDEKNAEEGKERVGFLLTDSGACTGDAQGMVFPVKTQKRTVAVNGKWWFRKNEKQFFVTFQHLAQAITKRQGKR